VFESITCPQFNIGECGSARLLTCGTGDVIGVNDGRVGCNNWYTGIEKSAFPNDDGLESAGACSSRLSELDSPWPVSNIVVLVS
jgi:hypothetical protein